MFFNNWHDIWRVFIVGVLAYAALITILRVSGKRTLSKMNAFDFVVTIALGSTLATIILTKDITLAEGVAAFSLLILLQFIITWTSTRFKSFSRIVKSEPQLIYYNGKFLEGAMKKERIMKEEILQAIRNQGISSFDFVHSVVVETDGSISVIKKSEQNSSGILENVNSYPAKQYNR